MSYLYDKLIDQHGYGKKGIDEPLIGNHGGTRS
jgi:hypothetical protein